MLSPEYLKNYFFGFLFEYPYLLVEFLSGFIPIIGCLIYFKFVWRYSKVLLCYSVAILLLEIVGGIFSANEKRNHIIYLVFYLFESIFLSFFYFRAIQKSVYNLLLFIVLITSIIAIGYNIFNGTALLDNYSGTIQSLGFITVSLVCFYYILSKLEINSLKNSVLFWVNTGNLVYFSGRFFICLFLLQVLDPKVNGLEGYWVIMTVFLVIQRICLFTGISQIGNLGAGKS